MELTTAWNGTLDLGVVVVCSLPTDIHFCGQDIHQHYEWLYNTSTTI